MKQVIICLTVVALFAACGQPTDESDLDLAGKKELLATKKAELQELTHEVKQLEKEIQELDPSAEKPKTLVTTAKVDRKDFKKFIEIQGTVQSDDIVNVGSDIGGIILEMKVEEGDNIRKGALIARLDLEQIDKQIAELQTSLDLATETYERQKRLWDQNIGSEMQYLQAKNNKERLEKSLETLEYQKGKSKVYAPISGVIDRVMLKAGELAGPGMPLVQILNTNQVKVVASVPENYLQSIRKGDRVTVEFPALNSEQNARVSLGCTINPQNRTFAVEVELNNSRGLLKPNLLALMLINDDTEKDAVVVPLELIQQEVGGKRYVFVKGNGENGPIAKKVYVKIGESYENEIVIQSGLEGGEDLIIDGARSLAANEPISVKQG